MCRGLATQTHMRAGKDRQQRRLIKRAKRQKRRRGRMRKNPNQWDRLFAVVLVFLLSFLVEQSAFSQATVPYKSTDKNWSCLKRKDLLRDKQGRPVWLTSEELLDRVIERE